MSHYIPVYQYANKMPVDISFVFEEEKPAGKHGFCKVDGENFRFEDGTLAKFWGVIFNGAACFPEHDYAEAVAQRLEQTGCNIVRFHQMDAEWATPNLFRFTSGKRLTSTRKLDEKSMERLDYLIKCLKEHGIYAAVDMNTYRKFKSGDGVACANELWDNHKQYPLFDPTMIELQKEFCTNFWNHHNPYTGLQYKDDPFFVFCDMINENCLFYKINGFKYNRVAYYDNMFRAMFADWLKEQGITYDWENCDIDATDKPVMDFKIFLMRKFARTMYDHIRSLGVKIPLCCTNWAKPSALYKAQEEMDFCDSHPYVYDWGWHEYEKMGENVSLMDKPEVAAVGSAASGRIHGKPFVLTEWDMTWPNAYRCEGPIWFPAMACFQNWSSLTIHTYSYDTHRHDHHALLGKEASSATIGCVPFREGPFTCWNDPAKFGLFYHGALMVRRGDVKPANHVVGGKLDNLYAWQNKLATSVLDIHQIHGILDTTDTSDLTDIRSMDEEFIREDPKRVVSDTGEIWRDMKRKVGGIDTPMTKALFGQVGLRRANNSRENQHLELELNGLRVDADTDIATIAISSLTKDPIEHSDNMLLSAIGRASNHGQRVDGGKLLDIGTGPIEAEVIHARIEIRTTNPNLRVWSVNSEGFYIGKLDTVYEDGWLKFHIGPNYPGLYYLIMEE